MSLDVGHAAGGSRQSQYGSSMPVVRRYVNTYVAVGA